MIVLPLISIYISERLYEKLLSVAKNSGLGVEEIIIKLLSRELGVELDPLEEVELHLRLSEKLLAEAEELLRKGDYIQASEKAWGAAAHVVKALAAKEGRKLESHSDLWRFVSELATKLGDKELRYLWRTANALHQNFYEGWMPPEEVVYSIEDVKVFVEKLRKLLGM